MRTVYVFALIFLAVSAMAEVNTKRAGLITKHIYSLIQTGYTVDTVVQLLTALLNVSQANLDELEENWDITRAALLDNIANIQALDDAQHQHCADIEATINDLKEEVRRYVTYIHDAQDTLEQNNENLASRLDARCSGNLLYVGHLKANQDSLRLLHFLRDQVSNPGFRDYLEGANDAFVELHHHLSNKKRSTLSMLAKHHMMAMIQQAYTGESDLHYSLSARSDSEIGTGHIDNDQSALSVDDFTIDARNLDDFIAELLGFVDDLIDQISEDSRQLQAAEFNAVEDLIDYQDQIEADAIVLNRYITLWVQHVEDLQETIEQDQDAWEECEERAEELDDSLEAAEEDYDEREAAFEDRQSSLQHTVDALQEIIDVYVNTVANAAIEYKARFDHEMDQMAADRARHAAELEEEERAEIDAQIAADKAGSYASAAESSSSASSASSASSSESTGPISAWISNQEVLEAEEAVAAAAAEEEEESSSSSTETESETESSSSSTASESLITISESSATFASFSTPTTEWAPIETYDSSTWEESSSTETESSTVSASTWTGPSASWSAAPSTETYTESSTTEYESYSTGAAWSLSVSTETASESSSSSSTVAWEPSESSSTEESTWSASTWTYQSLSESSSTEEESSTAAWSAYVSAAQSSTVESSSSSTEAVSDLFNAAVSAAASTVSESTAPEWGAAAASSSSSSESESAGAWEWNAETTESSASSSESSSSEGAFFQKRGNLRRRF